MCPACMTTAALIATGATSASGLVGLFAVKLRRRGLSNQRAGGGSAAGTRDAATPGRGTSEKRFVTNGEPPHCTSAS